MNKKIVSAILGSVLAGAMMLPAPVAAQSGSLLEGKSKERDRFVSERCIEHPRWRGCDDWRKNRHRWSDNDYRRWYRWNEPSIGGIAAGIFGLAVGAAIVNSINNGGYSSSHVARCEARYRSYNARTDMYLGYDGQYHRCRL